jgi:type VI protein secretion system component VasF
MTTKIYRRFLLAAMMLFLTAFLVATGPTQQAAEETCDECNARCEQIMQDCHAQGLPFGVCAHMGIQCTSGCLYGVCSH